MVVCVFEFFRVAVLALIGLGVVSLGKRGGLLHMSAGSFCCAASCLISTSNLLALRVLPYCHAAKSPRARSRGDVSEVTGCKPGRTQKHKHGGQERTGNKPESLEFPKQEEDHCSSKHLGSDAADKVRRNESKRMDSYGKEVEEQHSSKQ